MAADWIKMRCNLWDDPRVARICDDTDQPEAAVVGALYWLWASADQHSEDGVMSGLSLRQIDRKTGVFGIGQALVNIGWIADHPEGIRIIRFDEHNGKSAKKRANTAKRVADFRNGNDVVTHEPFIQLPDVTQQALQIENEVVTDALARERIRNKEIKENTYVASVAGNDSPESDIPPIPDCPHAQIIKLYAEKLPELAQPKVWEGERMKRMKARWRWVLTARKANGQPYAVDRQSALEFFSRYFDYIRKCPFLLGENDRNWTADLAWLLKAENFAKVIEGTYEREVEVTA